MHSRGTCAILIGLALMLSQPAAARGAGIEMKSYDIDASIGQGGKVVRVQAECDMWKTNSMEGRVLLGSAAQIASIRCQRGGAWLDMRFSFAGKDSLLFGFPSELSGQGPVKVRFTYDFPIDPLGDSLLLLDRGNRWYPLIPDQVASFRLSCEVPAGYTVLSAGDLIEEKDSGAGSRFVWGSKVPIFKLPLVVFRSDSLRRTSARVASKSVVFYSSTADSTTIDSVLAEAGNAFAYFNDFIGEYPYKCMTLVEVPYFDGIDISSGLVMAGSPSIRAVGKGYYEGLHLAVAEQWFGAGVFGEFQRPGFWFMTISLPQYLRLMYLRHSAGQKAYGDAMRGPMDEYMKFAGKKEDVPILDVDYPDTREKGLVLYGKGPYVLSKMDDGIGADRWKDFLRDLYRQYRGKVLKYEIFRADMAKYAKSSHLLELFEVMMTKTGLPPG